MSNSVRIPITNINMNTAYQIPSNMFNPIPTNRRAATLRDNITPQGNHQQRLLRTIQKMLKEVAVIMPPLQFPEVQLIIRIILWFPKIDDEAVAPAAHGL